MDRGIQHRIFDRNLSGKIWKYTPEQVTEDMLDTYFVESKEYQQIQIDIKPYSLLPTREYKNQFVDHVRLWINEQSSQQPHIRDRYERQAMNALRDYGIDIRDGSLTFESARKAIYPVEERKLRLLSEGIQMLNRDPKLKNQYF